ncbi:hypothetical protein ACIQAL_09345 [Pseudomonas sp. NPDC088368]|uniref:hypothetical protein n=1 Tax=Pseudomonas sp. NPDC088368 TaxID=3364453 RepID=UPI0038180D61
MNAEKHGVLRIFAISAVGLITAMFLNGCALAPKAGNDCEKNFAAEGSFFSGKRFITTSVLPGIVPEKAYDSLYKILVSDGFYIQNSDKEKKAISAFQNVNLSDKKAPLNARVEPINGGSKVSLVFIASAGIYTPESGARDAFCRIIARVGH